MPRDHSTTTWKHMPRKRRRVSEAHIMLGLYLAFFMAVGAAVALSHWRVLL